MNPNRERESKRDEADDNRCNTDGREGCHAFVEQYPCETAWGEKLGSRGGGGVEVNSSKLECFRDDRTSSHSITHQFLQPQDGLVLLITVQIRPTKVQMGYSIGKQFKSLNH